MAFRPGAVSKRALQSVTIFCTDELHQNVGLRDGTDFCLIRPDANDAVAKFANVLAQPDGLATMGRNGRDRLMQLYGPERQIEPRIALLRAHVDKT